MTMTRSAAALLGCALGLLVSVLVVSGVYYMSQTAVYSVYNPASDTEYVAPVGFQIIPNANSLVTVTVQLYAASGMLLAPVNEGSVTAYIYDVTSGSNVITVTNSNASSATANGGTTPYTWIANGTDVVTVAAQYHFQVPNLTVARMDLQITQYVGSVYSPGPGTASNVKVVRSGAWTTPTAIKVRRSGAWINATAVYVRRNGAWTKVWG